MASVASTGDRDRLQRSGGCAGGAPSLLLELRESRGSHVLQQLRVDVPVKGDAYRLLVELESDEARREGAEVAVAPRCDRMCRLPTDAPKTQPLPDLSIGCFQASTSSRSGKRSVIAAKIARSVLAAAAGSVPWR